MTVDEFARILGTALGLIISIGSVWGLIVSPFKNAMRNNDLTMRSLQETIQKLSFELQESQRDRQNIHNQLDKHEARIGKAEDDIIVNNERIATLFKSRKD